jgi:hypothetical protein
MIMALTQEQLNRIEELKSNKAELISTRSRLSDSIIRGQNILNNLQIYWDNPSSVISSSPSIPKEKWIDEIRSQNTFEQLINRNLTYVNNIYGDKITMMYNSILYYINNSEWDIETKNSLKSTLETTLNNL